MNLASVVAAAARRVPRWVALRCDATEVTYEQLDRATAALAAHLGDDRGVAAGDRVALCLSNGPSFAIGYYAALHAGAIVVPLDPALRRGELAARLRDADVAALLAAPDAGDAWAAARDAAVPELCELPEVSGWPREHTEAGAAAPCAEPIARAPHDTAAILYTSGTSGEPKGAELTHDNLLRNLRAAQELYGLQTGTTVLGVLPLHHGFGQTCTLNATIAAGGTLTLLERFDAGRVLEVLERDAVAVFVGVPTMYADLLDRLGSAPSPAAALRVCGCGAAPLDAELLQAFEARFGVPILEGYGLTETSPIAAANRSDRERRPGSIGQAIDGVEIRLVDAIGAGVKQGEVGEIAIRGHNVMKGYWRRPRATATVLRDGWLHSGDLARVDEDGHLYVVDRLSDVIIRGGRNVYPGEVERVLLEHPAVRDVAVVAIRDARLGEEVGAAVALHSGRAVGAGELARFAGERLASFKRPRSIWFVDELPRNRTGKVVRREVAVPAAPVADAGA